MSGRNGHAKHLLPPGKARSDEVDVTPSAAEKETLAREAERVTPAKGAIIGAGFVLTMWLTAEGVYETLRVTGGLAEGTPPSALRRFAFGNRRQWFSQDVCYTDARSNFPLTEPLGDCSRFDPEFDLMVHSLVNGHSVGGSEAQIRLRMWANCVHLFGALSSLWLLLCCFLLGGTSSFTRFKQFVVGNLVALPYEMLLTGCLMFFNRDPSDKGYPAVTLYPSSSAYSATGGRVNFWHDAARYGFFTAFACSFIVLTTHATIFTYNRPPVAIALHAISAMGWTVALLVFFVRLFTLEYPSYLWAGQFQDLWMLSIYPIIDLPCIAVLFWAWYKGRVYDWNEHRNFALATFAIVNNGAILVYFTTNDKGPVFGSTTPVLARIIFTLLILGPWAVMFYIPFLKRVYILYKQGSAPHRRSQAVTRKVAS
mmetsp:Transcript_313/g.848  ORF Transcript_313/g.848 Transcript_313/m.848 type:complete len:425 (-) Transcript_313:247-1521(-)